MLPCRAHTALFPRPGPYAEELQVECDMLQQQLLAKDDERGTSHNCSREGGALEPSLLQRGLR